MLSKQFEENLGKKTKKEENILTEAIRNSNLIDKYYWPIGLWKEVEMTRIWRERSSRSNLYISGPTYIGINV